MTRSCATAPSSWTGRRSFTLYTQTVGTIRPEDGGAEKDFYKFVEEQGL